MRSGPRLCRASRRDRFVDDGLQSDPGALRCDPRHDAARRPDLGRLVLAHERLSRSLRADARPSRNKLARLQDAEALEELGLKLMEEAEAAPERNYHTHVGLTALQRALAYRDGLMIALLIRRPFRIKNFHSLRLGHNLILEDGGAHFVFEPGEMKNKRSLEAAFPAHLLPALRRYLAYYRTTLLTNPARRQAW